MTKNALTCLATNDVQSIKNAVQEAEKKTSAEIVCAVATESGRYDRAEGIGGVFFSLAFLLGFQAYGVVMTGAGQWAAPMALGFMWQAVLLTGGYIFGSVLLSYIHPLRRLLTSQKEMKEEAQKAASHVFQARGLHRTQGHGGILIFVSLFERQVVVLTDQGVTKTVGNDFSNQLRDKMTPLLHQKKTKEAFVEAIHLCVAKLETLLPVKPDDKNELPNDLLQFHPRP